MKLSQMDKSATQTQFLFLFDSGSTCIVEIFDIQCGMVNCSLFYNGKLLMSERFRVKQIVSKLMSEETMKEFFSNILDIRLSDVSREFLNFYLSDDYASLSLANKDG